MENKEFKEDSNSKERKLFKDVIETYVEKNMLGNEENEEVLEIVCNDIGKKVFEFVVREEVSRIEKEAKERIDQSNQKNKIKQIKVIIIETLILGCLVGLFVNQVTDVISIIKGSIIDVNKTIWFIIIILILNLLFAFLAYINKLGDIFIGN